MLYKIIKLFFLLIAIVLIAYFIINSADKTNAASSLCVENKTGCFTGGNHTCSANGDTYCTIQAAVLVAVSGDTIWVAPGTYNESVVINNKKLTIKGDLKNESTYFPDKKGWVILDGNKDSDKNIGFEIKNDSTSGAQTHIFNFIIRNFNQKGIYIHNQKNDAYFGNMYWGKIKNNIIYNNGENGIKIEDSTWGAEIDNNLIAEHSSAGIYISYIAKWSYFQNNTFYHNGNYGIYVYAPIWPGPIPSPVYGGLDGSVFRNNIFVNHKINSLYGYPRLAPNNPIIEYNDFYNDPLVFVSAAKCNADICDGNNNKTDNPQFALGGTDENPALKVIDNSQTSICSQPIPFEKKSSDFQLYLASTTNPLIDGGTNNINNPTEIDLSNKSTQYLNASYAYCPKDTSTTDMGFHYPKIDSSVDTSCLFTSEALNTNLATTTMRFWIKTADTKKGLAWVEWMGPDGADNDGWGIYGDYGDYFSAPYQPLTNLTIKRYIKYRVQLKGNGWYTPKISEVRINYQK